MRRMRNTKINTLYTGVQSDEAEAEEDEYLEKLPDHTTISSKTEHPVGWWRYTYNRICRHRKFNNRCRVIAKTCFHGFPFVVIALLTTGIILLSTVPVVASSSSICDDDGHFNLDHYGETYYASPWSLSGVFNVNLTFGSLNFATAKLIDVSWDLVMGRAGQGLLAFVSYKVFTRALYLTMQTRSVPCATFEAVTLQGGTVDGLTKIVKNYSRIGGFRTRASMIWMIVSAVFVLAFPTLVSAMTAYRASFNPFVWLPNGSLVSVDLFQTVIYIIHDGSRLGAPFYDEYPVIDLHNGTLRTLNFENVIVALASNQSIEKARMQYMSGCSSFAPGKIEGVNDTLVVNWPSDLKDHPSCDLLWHVSQYTFQYGFTGDANVSSTLTFGGQMYNISGPTLNIDAYFSWSSLSVPDTTPFMDQLADWSIFPYGIAWNTTESGDPPYSYQNEPTFALNETVYGASMMNNNGWCQSQGAVDEGPISYQWGFSTPLLLWCLLLLLIWSVGMYAFHMDSYMNLNPSVAKRGMGLQRAIFDLSAGYNKSMKSPEVTMMHSNKELQKAIGSGHLTYQDMFVDHLGTTRQARLLAWWRRQDGKKRFLSVAFFEREGFVVWATRELSWLCLMLSSVLLFALSWSIGAVMYAWCPYSSILPVIGCGLALCLARRKRVRWSLIGFMLVIHFAVDIWWIVTWYVNVYNDSWIMGYVHPAELQSQFNLIDSY